MESYLRENRRIYECNIHPWVLSPDFLDGAPAMSPIDDQFFNIRTFLKECHISNVEAYINTARYDFFNISSKSIKQATNSILSILNVAEEHKKSMTQEIVDYAENMANKTYRGHSSFFMVVEVNADIIYHNNDNCEVIEISDQVCQAMLPSKSSHNKLKGVKLQQKEELSDCAICLSDFRIDAAQMPCSHLFHGNCIVGWLLRKNNCPLCRFTNDN